MNKISALLLVFLMVFSYEDATARTIISQYFTSASEGDVKKCKHVRRLFGACDSIKTSGSQIDVLTHPTNGKVMRFRYPAYQIGPKDSGGSFTVPLDPEQHYNLEYTVRFGTDFDFGRGGKLPGFGGGEIYNGGRPANAGDGFNARLHWNTGGELTLYLYYQDQPNNFGEHIPMNQAFNFVPNGTYRITQYVEMNTPHQADGVFRLWVNGVLMLDRDDIRFMSWPNPQIDKLNFESFFGGADVSYAPKNDTHADFDEVRVW